MKLSVSLSEEDVQILDSFAVERGLASRSAVIQYAVRQLAYPHLEDDYAEAWREWESGEDAVWDAAVADGIGVGPRHASR